MQGFNQRQLEQLEEIVKRVIVQVLAEEKAQYPLATLEEVQDEGIQRHCKRCNTFAYHNLPNCKVCGASFSQQNKDVNFKAEKANQPLGNAPECTGSIGYCEMEIQNGVEVTGRITDDGVKTESIKPKISSHLYNNGRFACCCEVCTCGEPKLKDEVPESDTFQCFNCGEFNTIGDKMCTYCGIYF